MNTLLSINNYYYRRGGAETLFFEHNNIFTNDGWLVIPFAMQHPSNYETEWSKYFIEELEFGAQYKTWGKIKRSTKVIYSFEARKQLNKLIAKIKPNICHLHNIYHHISPSILGVLSSNSIPTIMTLHDLKLACPAYKMLTHDGICERCKGGKYYNVIRHKCVKNSTLLSSIIMVEAYLHSFIGSYSNNVDYFIAPSRFLLNKMVEWGWETERLVYIPNFIDVDKYIPNYSPGRSFAYIGRLVREKGIETLIRASVKAGVALDIIGDGPEKQLFQELALNQNAKVNFLGYLGGKELHDRIRTTRAVILPSELYENAPLSILESYALGKPVIGSSIGGIPELIKEGLTGFTFQAGSVESLANAMGRTIAASDSEIKEMGYQSRIWVSDNFNTNKYKQNVLNLYYKLAG